MIICSAWILVRQDLISSVIPNYFVLSLDVSASMVSFGLKPDNISADTREKCYFSFFYIWDILDANVIKLLI